MRCCYVLSINNNCFLPVLWLVDVEVTDVMRQQMRKSVQEDVNLPVNIDNLIALRHLEKRRKISIGGADDPVEDDETLQQLDQDSEAYMRDFIMRSWDDQSTTSSGPRRIEKSRQKSPGSRRHTDIATLKRKDKTEETERKEEKDE